MTRRDHDRASETGNILMTPARSRALTLDVGRRKHSPAVVIRGGCELHPSAPTNAVDECRTRGKMPILSRSILKVPKRSGPFNEPRGYLRNAESVAQIADSTCGKGFGRASISKSQQNGDPVPRAAWNASPAIDASAFRRSGLRAPKAPAPGSRRAPFSASSASYDLGISPMARPAGH